jgi:hypothetical protein
VNLLGQRPRLQKTVRALDNGNAGVENDDSRALLSADRSHGRVSVRYVYGKEDRMKKLLSCASSVALALLVPVLSTGAAAGDDILIADFEAGNYGDWKVEGTAFGSAPAKGTLSGQMEVTGFEGKGLVNTFLGGDGPKGKLA